MGEQIHIDYAETHFQVLLINLIWYISGEVNTLVQKIHVAFVK